MSWKSFLARFASKPVQPLVPGAEPILLEARHQIYRDVHWLTFINSAQNHFKPGSACCFKMTVACWDDEDKITVPDMLEYLQPPLKYSIAVVEVATAGLCAPFWLMTILADKHGRSCTNSWFVNDVAGKQQVYAVLVAPIGAVGGKTYLVDWQRHEELMAQNKEASRAASPDRAFNQNWAQALLEKVQARLEQKYQQEGKAALFAVLWNRLLDEVDEATLQDLGAALGMEVGAVRMAVTRLRKRFAAALREEVAQTVATPEAVEEELRYLIASLSGELGNEN